MICCEHVVSCQNADENLRVLTFKPLLPIVHYSNACKTTLCVKSCEIFQVFTTKLTVKTYCTDMYVNDCREFVQFPLKFRQS